MSYSLTQSIDLNGSSQSLTAPDSASLSPTGAQTHEGWLNFDTTPSIGNGVSLFDKYDPTGNQRGISVVYENSGGTLRFLARTSNNGSTVASGTLNHTITTGAWNHYRFVYRTAGSIQIYVDEASIGTITGLSTSIFDNTALYRIGFNTEISGYFDGKVSLWRVWNEERTAADRCVVYGTSTSGMQAEWSLNNVLTDASGNSNTLTNVGSATFVTNTPAVCAVVANSRFFAFM